MHYLNTVYSALKDSSRQFTTAAASYIMSSKIQKGPVDNSEIPHQSIGITFYNALKNTTSVQTLIVDSTGEEIHRGKFLKTTINLAKKMSDLGTRADDVITIISHNHWKYLATVLAGFYIGAKVNLLNPDYALGELNHLIEICQPVLIFCTTKTLDNVLKLKNRKHSSSIVIYDNEISNSEFTHFDKFLENLKDDTKFEPRELNPKESVAFILTSSGTTGLPKCVQLTHHNFRILLVYGLDPYFIDLSKNDVVLGFLPFFHILGNAAAFLSLISEAKLVIMDKFKPDNFLNAIQQYRITKLFAVPPILFFLVKNPVVQNYDLSSIEDILCSAASATKELEEMVENKLHVTAVRQMYGMTEMCGAVTITPKNSKRHGSSGKVTTSHEVKVCDPETGKVLSANKIGELRFRGDGVMKGYLDNNKDSKEAFDEEGYLRSGDLGYYDDEGYFYVVERLKEIIKYKCFQVSPTELETLLIQHSAVKDAAVIGIPDEIAGELPLAFIVKQPNMDVTEQELVRYVAENMSVQKHLHGGVRFIDEIPKSSSGKILRRKLKELL